jgi:hypothetical protein
MYLHSLGKKMVKVTFPLLLIVFIICVEIVQTQSSFIKVDNTTKQYTDSTGRTRLFHGVNAVLVLTFNCKFIRNKTPKSYCC